MRVNLSGVTNGSYNLDGDIFKFHLKQFFVDEDGDNKNITLVLGKKSALEIMITLLDSQNLSTSEAEKWEEMLEKIQNKEE